MRRGGPRILLIGGSYRALCVLERLLERGERVAAFVGQEGGGERDFCSEILEICDRSSVPARSARKFGEELVRWLEDRIRPELAIAVGVSTEIPLAIGGNCRGGMVVIVERPNAEGGPRVELLQRGQVVAGRRLGERAPLDDPDDVFAQGVEATLAALDEFLDRLAVSTPDPSNAVPTDPDWLESGALEQIASEPEPGAESEALERQAAAYLGAERVLALASPAAAFALLGAALGIAGQDEVVAPPLVSGSTLQGLARAGARVVLADVESDRLTLDVDRASDAITARTRALVVAHAFGMPADLAALRQLARERGVELIEDGGSALGARMGDARLGREGTCVFRLRLGAGAPGAEVALVALSRRLAGRVEAACAPLRVGQGAARLALRRLAAIDERVSARRALASLYSAELSPYDAFVVPPTPADALSVYAGYPLRVTRFARASAEDLTKLLVESGIEARRIRMHCAERDLAGLPVAEGVRSTGLLLPISHALAPAQIERVLEAIFDYAIG
jgi:dTDP-4-amino-4,6-dideoxygalactose transaminase